MSKVKSVRIMEDLERLRCLGNWQKIVELCDSHEGARGTSSDVMYNIISVEAKLQLYIKDTNEDFTMVSSRDQQLQNLRMILTHIFDSNNASIKVNMEANLLLAKLNFASGKFEDSLSGLTKTKLEQAEQELPSLHHKILLAEAYAIKAICLEIMQPQKYLNRHQRISRMEKINFNYSKAANVAIVYLQLFEKKFGYRQQSLPTPFSASTAQQSAANGISVCAPKLSLFVQVALQQLPLSYVKSGNLTEAVEQYRRVLSILETAAGQRIQQILCCQYAELLHRGITDLQYQPPIPVHHKDIVTNLLTVSSLPLIGSLLSHAQQLTTLFSPVSRYEEIYNILCLAFFIGQRKFFDDSGESDNSRKANASLFRSVLNTLIQLLVGLHQFNLLSEFLRLAIRVDQEDAYVWLQYAFSLLCSQQDRAAEVALRNLQLLMSDQSLDSSHCLVAARLQLEHFDSCEEAVRLSAASCETASNAHAKCRSKILTGLARSRMADLLPDKTDIGLALMAFEEAVNLDPGDYMAHFYLALEHAMMRNLELAEKHCRFSWELCPDHPNAPFLLALLLTARKQYEEALELVEESVAEYPLHSAMLLLRLRLYAKLLQREHVMTAAKELLLVWRTSGQTFQCVTRSPSPIDFKSNTIGGSTVDTKLALGLQRAAASSTDRNSDVGQADVESLTVSGIGDIYSCHPSSSEEASMHFSDLSYCAIPLKTRLRGESCIWLELAETLLDLGMLDDVGKCIEEASALPSVSTHALYLKGRLYELSGCQKEAAICYEMSLSTNPAHFQSARCLALVHQERGDEKLAEKLLRDIVRSEPFNYENWMALAELLSAMGNSAEAVECFTTGRHLAATNPLLPFSIIPRCIRLA